MSIEAMNWALSQQAGSSSAKSVLLILANRADQNGRCWPGIDGIAEQTELTRRSVINQIAKLVANGLICVERRGGDGGGRKSNVYLLHIAAKCNSCTLGQCETGAGQCANGAGQCANGAGLSEPLSPEPSINPKKKSQRGATPRTRGSRTVPDDEKVTADMIDWAVTELGLTTAEVTFETDKWRDHEYPKPITDFTKAWRNWMRRAKGFRQSSVGESPKSTVDDEALRLGIKRLDGEPIETFERRVGDALTAEQYGRRAS